jgi:hypothetical protein
VIIPKSGLRANDASSHATLSSVSAVSMVLSDSAQPSFAMLTGNIATSSTQQTRMSPSTMIYVETNGVFASIRCELASGFHAE